MNKQLSVNKQKRTSENLETLIELLASKDGMIRQKARESLVIIGKPAVPSITKLLQNSGFYQIRWEAAKILGGIDDKRAIPSLVKALEDNDHDVSWLAAEALSKFKKAAWPALLRLLIKSGSDSVLFRHGVHHVLKNQKEEGFNDLLAILKEALESKTIPESAIIAANDILKRMKTEQKKGRNK